MITVYSADCTDFSNNGLSVLKPIECTIHEIAGGSYELNMVHPIDPSNRWAQITNGCFIKAPAPVRESPMYEDDAEGTTEETVTREIYKVATNGLKLRLRQEPSMDSKVIGSYPPNTEVAKLDESGAWYKVSICDGGAVGYMYGGNLTYVRDAEETITNNKPVTREAVKVIPSRDQLFRVVSVEADSETGLVTVKALHVFYDLRGNLVNDDYKPEGVAADEVVSHIASHLLNPSSITLHCYNEEPVSGDYAYKSAVEALLDPDEGVLTKSDSLLIRDNFDAYLIPNQTRDMGVTVRRGKNLVGAVVTYDSSDIVTRIIPVGKDKDGNDLFLDGTIYVDSPHINDYPTIFSVRKDYNVRVVKKDPDNVTTFTSIDDARAELRDLALDEFDAGVDVPSYSIDVDFVLLSQAQGYEDYADLQSIHMYDTVTVIDSMIGLNTKIKMTEYEWDCLAGMYNSVKLCDAQSVEQTVYSYNLPTGGVSGSKISTGSLSGNAIRSASIDYAKINNAAIDQLTADSITAVRATIRELVAQQITTDQLYADLASIAVAQITTANIDNANINWAQIQTLAAEIATVATAEIGTAKIGHGQIYDLSADTALITKGSAGNFFFDKLSVSSAQMVDLTVGQLTVKASNGNYYSLDVDLDTGNVTANQVTVTQAEIDAGKTSTGNHIIETDLTVTELSTSTAKATEALINKLTAQRIDVAELFAQQAFIAALDANVIKASNIQALEGQLNIWANDKIQLAVNDMEVGGTNLLPGTRDWSGAVISRATQDGTYQDCDVMHYNFTNSGSPSYSDSMRFNNIDFDSGGTYMISFWCKGSGSFTLQTATAYMVGTRTSSQGVTGSGNFGEITINVPTDWTRIWVKWQINSGTWTDKSILFRQITTASNLYVAGVKLERGDKATDWSESEDELINSSVTINDSGIYMSTKGTLQIDADDPAKKGRIALGELMSLDYTGGLQAKDGSFANSLKVNGKQVMTAAEITAPIKVATSQPSGHGFLWVKPTSVTSASYSAYSAGSRDSTVHFGATNPITRSFTADTTATLANATFTYTLDFDVYCLTDLAQVTNVKFTAVATKGSASVSFGASAAMTMTKYTLAHVTLTASSSTNLCTNSNAISVAITASASSLTKLFIQSDQYMTLKISNQAGTGTQTCSVYYVN